MRYDKDQLTEMAGVHLKSMDEVFGCTDGHFFYQENEAKAHLARTRGIEYFPFKKLKKQAK